MDKGEISIDAAAQIAKQPAEEENRVIALPRPKRQTEVRSMRDAAAKPASETGPTSKVPQERWTTLVSDRPSNNLRLCRFLLEKITNPVDVEELKSNIAGTYNQMLQEYFAQALAELEKAPVDEGVTTRIPRKP